MGGWGSLSKQGGKGVEVQFSQSEESKVKKKNKLREKERKQQVGLRYKRGKREW